MTAITPADSELSMPAKPRAFSAAAEEAELAGGGAIARVRVPPPGSREREREIIRRRAVVGERKSPLPLTLGRALSDRRLRIGLPTRASVCARDPPSARPLKPNNAIGECTQNGPRPDSARLMTLFEKKKGAAEGTVGSFSSPPRSRLLALRGQCTDATNAGWSSLA